MKKIVTIISTILLYTQVIYCQTNPDLTEFNRSRNLRTRSAIKVLGIWAIGNIGIGGYYYYTSAGSDKYFNQMNVMWNGVNMAIVVASLLPKQHDDLNLTGSVKAQSAIEATYIANSALDLVYSSLGLYLTEKAKTDIDNKDKWNGWGNSLIMQGGFLFLLDTTMFAIHKTNGKKLYKMLDKVNISTSGLGMKVRIRL